MRTISVFNNKGGVGKTTLTFHLAHALAELGHRTLLIDLDPQCNLTIFGMDEEILHHIWEAEDAFVDDFDNAKKHISPADFTGLLQQPRSIHFLLKPTEDGTAELQSLSRPFRLADNLDLIPGRLTMHMYEDKVSSRWSEVYQGDPLAIRTVTRIRSLAEEYAREHDYSFVITDTSPSLGMLNRVVISTADGFVIPCMPDMFSLYGIKNIGNSLSAWKKQFDTIFQLLSENKRHLFPEKLVRFLGFTIYNARKYASKNPLNKWDLATAHYNYAMQIPDTITRYIRPEVRDHLSNDDLVEPIGGRAVMHSHSTLPSMAQKYHLPVWKIPACSNLEADDKPTISGNRAAYEGTQERYREFALALLGRLKTIE
jgi:cellulose biosynthesis protein BcsQ